MAAQGCSSKWLSTALHEPNQPLVWIGPSNIQKDDFSPIQKRSQGLKASIPCRHWHSLRSITNYSISINTVSITQNRLLKDIKQYLIF